MTFGVVLADHERATLEAPDPERVCATPFALLANATLPAAGPGDPAGGAKAALYCMLCPEVIVNGTAGRPVTENELPLGVTLLIVTSTPTAVRVPI